jgi:hypothetical protein
MSGLESKDYFLKRNSIMYLREFNTLYSKNKYFFCLCFFYLLAHGGILFIPNAIYWDDWYIFQSSRTDILDTFSQAGSMLNLWGYLHINLINIGIWPYRLFTFILFFGSGLAFNSIIKNHKEINHEQRFILVLLFLIMPFNMARVAIINFPYTLSYFLFFLGWALFSRLRTLSLGLFFLSFNTNSLLLFYTIPFFEIYYRNTKEFNWNSFALFVRKYLDLAILPFVYFSIKILFFMPYGRYEGYNEQFHFTNLIISPYMQLADLMSWKLSLGRIAFVSLLVYFFLKIALPISNKKSPIIPFWGIFFGGFLIFLGCFPYWILGHIPTFNEWTSRHQLLMPLGSSIIILCIWMHSRASYLAIVITIAISLVVNLTGYRSFYIDWAKQKQLIKIFSENQFIRNAGLIVIDDKSENMNALGGRKYAFYEWNGIFKFTFGDEVRFGINKTDLNWYTKGDYSELYTEHYKASAFKKGVRPTAYLEIKALPSTSGFFINSFIPSTSTNFSVVTSENLDLINDRNVK